MKDSDCTGFLRWCLPRLGMRWPGFRKVRGQVCKRIARRVAELGLVDVHAYRVHLERHPDEWKRLDRLCQVTISRFYRDKALYDVMASHILYELGKRAAESTRVVRCWSAGCGAGEEPYTLSVVWQIGVVPRLARPVALRVVATGTDERLLDRAKRAHYPPSSVRELPQSLLESAFDIAKDEYVLREDFRSDVEFRCEDVRRSMPEGTFDLILCRNLVFTYFETNVQRDVLDRMLLHLSARGYLVVGRHEQVPAGTELVASVHHPDVYQRV